MGTSTDLKAKRDRLLPTSRANDARFIPSGVGAGVDDARTPRTSCGATSERASDYSPDARSPHTSDEGLDAFRSLVVRARVGRIMRERANFESRRLTDQILGALEDGPLSRTAIGNRFFKYTNRNDIGEVLRTLEAAGFVASEKIETDGRSIEMWRRVSLPRAEVNGA